MTLSTDLSLPSLAELRQTDPNPSEVNGKAPIDMNEHSPVTFQLNPTCKTVKAKQRLIAC